VSGSGSGSTFETRSERDGLAREGTTPIPTDSRTPAGETLITSYTFVYDLSEATKTIRVSESLHARIKAHNREGETLSETLERLVGTPSLRELAGILSDDADEFREAIEESHRDHNEEIERMIDRTKWSSTPLSSST
jgi:predicted CopG family antitoxin